MSPKPCARFRAKAAALFLLPLALCAKSLYGPAQLTYDRHVIVDPPLAAASFYNSSSTVIAPSKVDLIDGRIPMSTSDYVTAPVSLRLSWESHFGGDWQVLVKSPGRYVLLNNFEGDTLTFWVKSKEGLSPDDSPNMYLEDDVGDGSASIKIVQSGQGLPAGKWVKISIPLDKFKSLYGGTDDNNFTAPSLSDIVFKQGIDDGKPHTLLIDDVKMERSDGKDQPMPPCPTGLAAKAGERHVDLSWNPIAADSLLRFRIYRSDDQGKSFHEVGTQRGQFNRYTDFVGVGKTVSYKISAETTDGRQTECGEAVSATTRPFSDDELLTMVQEACFRYYWEGAHPNAGMAIEITPGDPNLVAVGSSGFGLMAILVGADRGFVTREACATRVLRELHFLKTADRFHGAWPHFLDGRTGKVVPFFGKYDDGADLVETAFLTQGLLAARGYFDRENPQEKEIRDLVTDLWQGIDWAWFRKNDNSNFLYWHWSPDYTWHISHPLIGWNETMIVYLLAISSPTHPVPPSMYYSGWAGQVQEAIDYRRGWSGTTQGDHYGTHETYYGIPLQVGEGHGGNLFFTQFSFLGFDPRHLRDRYTNYFDNNRALALINRAYCIDNPQKRVGYGPDCWGLSAGINSGGGTPIQSGESGTICCSAALGDYPYTPAESLAALKHFYRDLGPQTYGIYGFNDGFNQTQDWFEPVWMGLNQAQIVVGIENQRTGVIWKSFMSNPEIKPALEKIGFKPDPDPKD